VALNARDAMSQARTYLELEEKHKTKQADLQLAQLQAHFWKNAFYELTNRIARLVPEANIDPTSYLLECEAHLNKEIQSVKLKKP